jgi:hypothetical protein
VIVILLYPDTAEKTRIFTPNQNFSILSNLALYALGIIIVMIVIIRIIPMTVFSLPLHYSH